MYELPRAAVTNSLNNRMYCLIVLEAQNPKLRWWQSNSPSEDSRGEFFLAFSSFWGLLEFLGIPWLLGTPLQSLPLSSHGLLFVSGSKCLTSPSPFSYKDNSH